MCSTTEGWLSVLACVGLAGLVIIVSGRGSRTSLEIPLLLLCLDDFAWNFAALAFDATHQPGFHWLDVSFSPFAPPLALHVIAAFVGKSREVRAVLIIAYAGFALLSASSLLAFGWPLFAEWTFSRGWSVVFLVGYALCLSWSLALLVSHLRHVATLKERSGSIAALIALTGGGLLTATELLDDFGLRVPPLGNVGTLFSMSVLTAAVLKVNLVDLRQGRSLWLSLVALFSSSAIVVLLVRLVQVGTAPLAQTLLVLTIFAAAAGFLLPEAMRRARFRRDTERRLASVGSLADQMAHDLRTPLAALKAGLQFVQEEFRRGSRSEKMEEFLALMLEQVERLNRTILINRQVEQISPQCSPVQVNDVIAAVLSLRALNRQEPAIVASFQGDLPSCNLDRDLFTRAFENLLSNALESMSEGGSILVRTSMHDGGWRAPRVIIEVEDSGTGIDPRKLNRVFGPFQTNKRGGTGWGLYFARRVVEAHGGRAFLDSRVGVGTLVRLELPI